MRLRWWLALLLTVTLAGTVATARLSAAGDVSLDDVLRDLRAALGGDKALSKVTALAAEGTFRRTFGSREMAGDVEWSLAFPDRYIRVETFSPTGDPGMRVIRTAGFNGEESLDGVTGGGGFGMMRFGGPGGPGAGPGGAAMGPQDGRRMSPERLARLVQMHRAEASRLALVMLGRTDAVAPLSLTYAGIAESPDGSADVLEVTLEGAPTFRLFVDRETHLPLMVAYREPAPRMNFQRFQPQPGAPPPSREEIERMMREAREQAEREPPRLQDVAIYFSDHRAVDGVMLPHVIRRAVDGTVTEEVTIARYRVNPKFKADTFKKR